MWGCACQTFWLYYLVSTINKDNIYKKVEAKYLRWKVRQVGAVDNSICFI
jgi:hypothetical protein